MDNNIARLRQAVLANPHNADHHANLGVYYTCAGRFAEAIGSYQYALRLRPDFAMAYSNLSYTFYLLGHWHEARNCGEQALALAPDYAEAHNHLGLALLALGQADAAAEHFCKALMMRPQLGEVHCNLGSARGNQGRLAEAVACFEQALHLKPGFAEAHSLLGDTFKKLGRFEEAIFQLREALRFKPDCAFAFWNLGQFAAQGLYRFSEEELGSLRALVTKDHPSLADGSLLHLTMGDVLDRQGAYDAAFHHYRQGNALRKEWQRQVGKDYDSADQHRLCQQLLSTFDETHFRNKRWGSSDSELPVFVVGMPRSGTTLVEQILASHSKAAGAGELTAIEQMVSAACPTNFRASPSLNQEMADRYLGQLRSLGGSAIRVVDKKPDNFLHLGFIALLFPNARVIHCRRDPLDTCLSCYVQHFTKVDYSWSLDDLGQYYRDYERLMSHWKRVLPLRMMDVSYEDLVTHQEAVSRELVDFCGLEWEDRCLAFHRNGRPVQTVSAVQVRRPMYASSIGRWRKYAAHLAPLRRALGEASASGQSGVALSAVGHGPSQVDVTEQLS